MGILKKIPLDHTDPLRRGEDVRARVVCSTIIYACAPPTPSQTRLSRVRKLNRLTIIINQLCCYEHAPTPVYYTGLSLTPRGAESSYS